MDKDKFGFVKEKQYIKIEDFTSVITGGTPSTSKLEYWEGGDIPWLQSGCCQNGDVYEADRFITQEGYDNSSTRLMPKNTVMIALTGATAGKVGYLHFEACGNQSITGILPSAGINQRYLFYYLLSQRNKILADCIGGAQPHISQGYVKNITVPMLPIAIQDRVVNRLNTITSLIEKRKEHLDHLDNLVKARFVEMFGDSIFNPLGFTTMQLSEIADIVSGITKGRKTNGTELHTVPYMAVSNVKAGYIDWSTVKTIEATQNEIEQYRLRPFDVLMTEGGDPDKLGRGAIINNPPENCIHQNHIFRVRVNRGVLLPQYLEEYLQHQKAKQYFYGCAKQTTGIASINMKQLRALPVLLPPIMEQERFAAFIEQIDKSKVAVQKSIDELQTLFDSLIQEYFG